MGFYAVLYTRNTRDRYFDAPSAINLMDEYEAVSLFYSASSLDGVYNDFQGEVWSPNGEKRELIKALDLYHTTISVGDVVIDLETWKAHVVARFGFDELPFSEGQVKAVLTYTAQKRQEKVGY